MPKSGSIALEARALVRTYADDHAVAGVDMEVRRGEIHAIVGLNGAGKTTLMRMLLGMIRPTSGRALIDGRDAGSVDPETWRQVGCFIGAPFAYPELTVRENLWAAALLHGLPRQDIGSAIATTVAEFDLNRWEHRRAHALSSGNLQRLGIASAVIHRPSILVLDEPTNALDPAGVVFIRDLLHSSAERGAAVLVSSHHLDQLARVAGKITMLHRGLVVGTLDPMGVDLEQQFFDEVYRADHVRGAA